MMIGVFAGDTEWLTGHGDPATPAFFLIRVDFLADFDHRESHFNNAQRLLSPNFPTSPSTSTIHTLFLFFVPFT